MIKGHKLKPQVHEPTERDPSADWTNAGPRSGEIFLSSFFSLCLVLSFLFHNPYTASL